MGDRVVKRTPFHPEILHHTHHTLRCSRSAHALLDLTRPFAVKPWVPNETG